jgi:hypothetical protein
LPQSDPRPRVTGDGPPVTQSLTAKDAEDAKEHNSLTAKDAEDTKEKKSFNAKEIIIRKSKCKT